MAQSLCKKCGQPIYGNALIALGASWHPEHFVCAACGLPFQDGQFNLHNGLPYHMTCFRDRIAPRCAFCGKALIGEYLIDGWGTLYCKEHQGQYPYCAYCGRLVPPQQQEQGVSSGGSMRCPICRSTAIEAIVEAQPIFRQLIQWVSSQNLRYNNLPITLELVDRPTLATYLQNRTSVDTLGATLTSTYLENGQAVHTEVNKVAVLQGLPKALFEGVTIHELGHVWLTVHGIQGLPTWAEEGFCELLAYRFYHENPTAESRYHAERIEKNPDPIYGEGFRRVRAIADRRGFPGFLEELRMTRRLPT